MLHAADVLIDLEPVGDLRRVVRHAVVARIAVAVEIPGRVDEGVHGIGFAARIAAAPRAPDLDKRRHRLQRRPARTGDLRLVRQQHGQIALRNRNHSAPWTMDHRDGRPPVALPRDAPVLDAERHGRLAEAFAFRLRVHAAPPFGARQARPFARVLHHAVVDKPGVHLLYPRQFAVHRTDHRPYRNAVLLAELEVALVVRGNRHNGAGSIAHQHEIAHPHRHFAAAIRVHGVGAGEEAFLLDIARDRGRRARLPSPWRGRGPPHRPNAPPAGAPAPGSRTSRRRSCPPAS